MRDFGFTLMGGRVVRANKKNEREREDGDIAREHIRIAGASGEL